jgi:hypothetical protein
MSTGVAQDVTAVMAAAQETARATFTDMAVTVDPEGRFAVMALPDWKAGNALGQYGGWELKGIAWKAA